MGLYQLELYFAPISASSYTVGKADRTTRASNPDYKSACCPELLTSTFQTPALCARFWSINDNLTCAAHIAGRISHGLTISVVTVVWLYQTPTHPCTHWYVVAA